MDQNIEIKARLSDLPATLAMARPLADGEPEQCQHRHASSSRCTPGSTRA